MNSLPKILVVDNGVREGADLLSTELAELGVSSVTASFEAADDVLGVIERPAAIFVRLPNPRREPNDYARILTFADALREREAAKGVPVILWNGSSGRAGISELLRKNVVIKAGAGVTPDAPALPPDR